MEDSKVAVIPKLILLLRSLIPAFTHTGCPDLPDVSRPTTGAGSQPPVRWRVCRPLERPGIPGIVPCFCSFEIRNDEVPHEDQDGDRLNEGADRDDQVERVPTTPGLVGVDPARHA